ncbi:hypothetical protein [Bradyrhizobium sp. ARR65]|uniref:hypothetical protein n=1 Tax=Bradyrhizobium sp. ARR65 TaxID=1040989 RepID=UPI000463CFFA|nr:hypothetical protein [Bradyrhizobium sp. ARR65]
MAQMQRLSEASPLLLQAMDFLREARRLKPGPERNELREVARELRDLARSEAQSALMLDQALDIPLGAAESAMASRPEPL